MKAAQLSYFDGGWTLDGSRPSELNVVDMMYKFRASYMYKTTHRPRDKTKSKGCM
jgi:hypothetical protein